MSLGLLGGTMLGVGPCDFSFTIDVNVDLWDGQAAEDFSQTASLNGIAKVRVTSTNGSINVTAQNGLDQATIAGEKRATGEDDDDAKARLAEIKIVVQPDAEDPSILDIEAILPKVNGRTVGQVSFEIALPPTLVLDLNATNGRIEVTGNGNRTAAETTTGEIKIKNNTGNVTAMTTSGSISLTGIVGGITAKSTNGSVNVEVTPPAGATVDLVTTNGWIDLAVAAATAADLTLLTTHGLVEAELTDFTVNNLVAKPRKVTCTLNGGGGTISARTTNGLVSFGSLD